MKFAKYAEREIRVMYFNGTGYVVRHEMYPHTTFTDNRQVTKQGHSFVVGARQGTSLDNAGFAYRRYRRPDTEPAFTPPTF